MAEFESFEAARAFFEGDRFAGENGMVLDELSDEGSRCSLTLDERHLNAEGGVMGGVIFTLVDFAFAAASSWVHRPTVVQQASMNFLSPCRGRRLIARARCRKDGRTSCVYQVDVTDEDGRDVAQTVMTGFKLPRR